MKISLDGKGKVSYGCGILWCRSIAITRVFLPMFVVCNFSLFSRIYRFCRKWKFFVLLSSMIFNIKRIVSLDEWHKMRHNCTGTRNFCTFSWLINFFLNCQEFFYNYINFNTRGLIINFYGRVRRRINVIHTVNLMLKHIYFLQKSKSITSVRYLEFWKSEVKHYTIKSSSSRAWVISEETRERKFETLKQNCSEKCSV